MKLRVVTALLVALPAAVLAQNATAQQDTIVVTGCVERAHRNGSLAGTPVGTSAVSPNTAADEANSQAPVDRYLLTGATVRKGTEETSSTAGTASGTSSTLRSFALKGHDAELREHNGQRVEITGTVAPSPKATEPPDRASLASGVEQLTIETMKVVGASCSGS
jgi:hypothetical protein